MLNRVTERTNDEQQEKIIYPAAGNSIILPQSY